MYRVMIVDDEPIFRLGIRSCVDWSKLGYVVVGEAENGQKAIQMMQQLHPDLMFLDIRMPVMDGLEVLKWAGANHPDTKIVVLSCLNEYEYVRQAMRQGALDYLFKPLMEAGDIQRVAGEALAVLGRESSRPEHAQPDGSRLLSGLNGGTLSLTDAEIRRELQALGLEAEPEQMMVGAMYLFLPASEQSARREQLAVTVRTLLQQELPGRCASLGERRGALLFALNRDCEAELPGLCRRIREYTGVPAAMGLSRPGGPLSQLKASIRQAADALSLRFVQGYSSVTPYQEPRPRGDFQGCLDRAQPHLEQAIGACDADLAETLLKQALDDAVALGCHDREVLSRFAKGCILNGIRAWRGRVVVEGLLSGYFDGINALSDADTLEGMTEQFRSLLQNLLTAAGLDPAASMSPAVQQILRYVEQHYDQSITLEQAAELVHMNKNYFCKLFKKEIGDNFISYLTRIRMEQATPLLMDGRWPAYQVAEMVGYNNYRYFCKLYKKHTGVTPGEVRRATPLPDGSPASPQKP